MDNGQQVLDKKRRTYHTLTEYEKSRISYLYGKGMSKLAIANELNLNRGSVAYYINKMQIPNASYGKTGRPRKSGSQAVNLIQANPNNMAPNPIPPNQILQAAQIPGNALAPNQIPPNQLLPPIQPAQIVQIPQLGLPQLSNDYIVFFFFFNFNFFHFLKVKFEC